MRVQWRPVPEWEGLYEVSDRGEVRSLPRRGTPGGVLVPHAGRTGHLTVNLSRVGARTTAKVHRLVLQAFVGPCPEGYESRHLNGVPADNRVENLRWGTRSEQRLDDVCNGVNAQSRKTHCPQGHEYDEKNTRVDKNGHRWCRRCDLIRTHRRRGKIA